MTTSVIMAYILPMMIGQTYDMGKDTPGIQIFNDTTFKNARKIVHYSTDSQYKMVENSKDIKDFLSVQGKLSVKIKSGQINVDGEGSYLKDRSSKSNSIELLVRVHFETETHSIPTEWRPKQGWKSNDKKYLGTHYCRSITFGGDLIAVVRFVSTNRYDKEQIKGAIQAGLNAKGVNVDVEGKLEKLKSELYDSSSMEINYYSTVPIPGVSYTIEGLMKLVTAFPSHVKKVNDGLGNPLRMELYPLSALDSTFPTYFEDKALNDQLEDLEDQLDDLLATRKRAALWLNDLPPLISDAASKKISEFIEKIEDIYGKFTKAISELDLSVGGTTTPFEDAFKAYKDDGNLLPEKYQRSLTQLQEEVYEKAPELRPEHGGANFVQWGKNFCSGPETNTVGTGIAIATDLQQKGGSSEIACSPYEPSSYFLSSGNYNRAGSSQTDITLSPIRYRGILKKFQQAHGKTLPCSVCRATRRTTSLVLHALTQCPDGWTTEYSGITMATKDTSAGKSHYACVDDNMQPGLDEVLGSSKPHEFTEVFARCGSLPCGPYDPKLPLPCIVCTR